MKISNYEPIPGDHRLCSRIKADQTQFAKRTWNLKRSSRFNHGFVSVPTLPFHADLPETALGTSSSPPVLKGGFCKLEGVLFVSVLILGALLFEVYVTALDS